MVTGQASKGDLPTGAGPAPGPRSRGGGSAGPLAVAARRRGLERLPDTGPAILCPNHISVLDSAFLMVSVPRRITFVGKAEYMDCWKTKYLFPALGMIPIDRSGGLKARVALDAAEERARRGELFGIYPEGTRSRDGMLHKGHTGAARLALQVGCPIFPVGIVGTDRDPAARRQAAEAVQVGPPSRSGGPIDRPERYADRGTTALVLRQITDEVMYEIRELSGQEYVNRTPPRRPRTCRRAGPRATAAELAEREPELATADVSWPDG